MTNEKVFDDVVVRYDLNAARNDCLDSIQEILENLNVAVLNLGALTADVADDVFRRLLRIGADAKWLAETLNKEGEE